MPGLCILFCHVWLMSLGDLLFSCGRLDPGKSEGGERYEKWRERKLQLGCVYERINTNFKKCIYKCTKEGKKGLLSPR